LEHKINSPTNKRNPTDIRTSTTNNNRTIQITIITKHHNSIKHQELKEIIFNSLLLLGLCTITTPAEVSEPTTTVLTKHSKTTEQTKEDTPLKDSLQGSIIKDPTKCLTKMTMISLISSSSEIKSHLIRYAKVT